LTKYERYLVSEALKRPNPKRPPGGAPLIDEAVHSIKEGEYERRMVEAALRSIAPDRKKE
jgi:hypothetical protein